MRLVLAAATAVLLALAPVPIGDTCTCAYARVDNGWCAACGVGYAAGFTVRSKEILDILHTHGHPADPKMLRCDSCREALAVDGFCDRSGMGFVRGEAYFTKLAYHLARGKPVADAHAIECPVCRSHLGRQGRRDAPDGAPPAGWCDACRVGIFGNLLYEGRDSFEQASAELLLLVMALQVDGRCHSCATAMLCGGMCPACRIDYAAGWPGRPPAPESRGGG